MQQKMAFPRKRIMTHVFQENLLASQDAGLFHQTVLKQRHSFGRGRGRRSAAIVLLSCC